MNHKDTMRIAKAVSNLTAEKHRWLESGEVNVKKVMGLVQDLSEEFMEITGMKPLHEPKSEHDYDPQTMESDFPLHVGQRVVVSLHGTGWQYEGNLLKKAYVIPASYHKRFNS